MKKTLFVIFTTIVIVVLLMGGFFLFKIIQENNLMKRTIDEFMKNKMDYVYSLFGLYPKEIKEIPLNEFKSFFSKNKFIPISDFLKNKNEYLNNITDKEKFPVLLYNYDENKMGRSLYLILDLGEKKILSIFIYYKNVLDLIFNK